MFVRWHQVRRVQDWFTPLDGCPRCGYPFEREPGYFLMSTWALNYGLGAALGVALYGLLEWFFDLPLSTLLAGVILPATLFNLLFVRHSKALFLAADLFCDPHQKEGGDDGGNVRLSAEPPGGGVSDRQSPRPREPHDARR
jgi:hypothetical protein